MLRGAGSIPAGVLSGLAWLLRGLSMSFNNLMMIYYKSVCGLPGVLQINFCGPSWGFVCAALPGGVYGLFAGRLCLRGYMFMQVIKGACVAFCAACVASCGAFWGPSWGFRGLPWLMVRG